MQHRIKTLGELFKTTFKEWNDKDPFRQSAVIAYYAIFGIPGLLILVLSIAGYFFGKEVVDQNILGQVSKTLGAETAKQIGAILVNVGKSKATVLGSIIGIVILLVGATGVFVELQKTLNAIWQVKVVPRKGLWPILKARLFSFGLLLAIAFLLLISLVVSTTLASMSNWMQGDDSHLRVVFFNVLNFIFSFAVISFLFALMFKILPDAKIECKHVWLGSIVTGLLFEMGKISLAFYFGKAQPASVYGAAGSVILILLWVSYSSIILFFGAEFTATYAKMHSGKIAPAQIAKPVASDKPQ